MTPVSAGRIETSSGLHIIHGASSSGLELAASLRTKTAERVKPRTPTTRREYKEMITIRQVGTQEPPAAATVLVKSMKRLWQDARNRQTKRREENKRNEKQRQSNTHTPGHCTVGDITQPRAQRKTNFLSTLTDHE
jgi:hypothetical protein